MRAYLDALQHDLTAASGRWARLSAASRDDLAYWHDVLHAFNGVRFMSPPAVSVTAFSDACTSWGWGFVCHDLRVYACGPWSDDPDIAPPAVHINALELITAVATAAALAPLVAPDTAIALRCDNTVAVASIERERGAGGTLANAARALDFISDTLRVSLDPSHIQGSLNVDADALSRGSVPAHLSSYRRLDLPSRFLTLIATSRRPSQALITTRG